MEPRIAAPTNDAEKTCPYCAETIKAAAIVCRFCNRELPGSTSAASTQSASPYAPCKRCGGMARAAFMQITAGLCRECAVKEGRLAEGERVVDDTYIYGPKGMAGAFAAPPRPGYTRNESLVCPHCGEKGSLQIKVEQRETGISGTKLAAAELTGGWSILFTGLSLREKQVVCYCEKCGMESTVK